MSNIAVVCTAMAIVMSAAAYIAMEWKQYRKEEEIKEIKNEIVKATRAGDVTYLARLRKRLLDLQG